MALSTIAGLLFTGLSLGQPSAGQADYYPPVAAAGRDLQNQLDFLARALATMPGRPRGRGFPQLTARAVLDLSAFRDQVQQRLPRADLYVSFEPVDRNLNQLLSELPNFGKIDPAIDLAARRTQTALNELHAALFAGDAKGGPMVEKRQLQTLTNRVADLESLADLLLPDADMAKAWNADFAEVRIASAELRRLHAKKADRADMKRQLLRADRDWEKLVARFKALSPEQALPLREDFGLVDQSFARLAAMFGITDRRAPLRVNFLP